MWPEVPPTRELEELERSDVGSLSYDSGLELDHLVHGHAVTLADDRDYSNNLRIRGNGRRRESPLQGQGEYDRAKLILIEQDVARRVL